MCILTLCAEGFWLAFVVFGVLFNELCSPVFAKRFGGVIWIGGGFQNVLVGSISLRTPLNHPSVWGCHNATTKEF